MSEAKHTPGPWKLHSQTTNQVLGYDQAEDATTKTVAFAHGYNQKEVDANARLIAAAPDLLEAGEDLHTAMVDLLKAYADVQRHYGLKPESAVVYTNGLKANKRLVAAIAKATGGDHESN